MPLTPLHPNLVWATNMQHVIPNLDKVFVLRTREPAIEKPRNKRQRTDGTVAEPKLSTAPGRPMTDWQRHLVYASDAESARKKLLARLAAWEHPKTKRRHNIAEIEIHHHIESAPPARSDEQVCTVQRPRWQEPASR